PCLRAAMTLGQACPPEYQRAQSFRGGLRRARTRGRMPPGGLAAGPPKQHSWTWRFWPTGRRQLASLPPTGQSPASWSISRQLVNLPPTGQSSAN
ncbi:hypothetical protein PENSTE_c060G02836, partial [Penicillium steckii]